MKKCPKCGREYEDANTLCPSDGEVLEKTSDNLIGKTLADKYRIEELLNKGGMGAVYRGTHVLMDKTVAVKVLHPALAADDKIVARFTREAKAASRISHPHALSVTDFGEAENGVVFLVMEYLHGRTLKEVIHEDGAMPLARATFIIKQISGALDEAHSQGVVHRDLKSDNIMLLDVGGGDWAKVLDFGIAKIIQPLEQDPALTSPNLIIGTPQYMSPEQCSQASDIDSRSDIYSLGIILYEMLVGHVPFTGESPTAIMMKHLQDAPPSVLEERRDLPAAVDKVVARALAKRPEDRYQSASQLTQALTLAAEESPVVASAVADTVPDTPKRATNRIIVTTGESEPARTTGSEERDDEETMVRPRESAPPPVFDEKIVAVETAPPSSFNPWRIIIPSFAALVALFAVIYAVSSWRSSSAPASNANTGQMPVDQNGRPVQPAPPATGQGEQGILPAAPVVVPSVSANTSGTTTTNSNSGETQTRVPEPEPSVNPQASETPQAETPPAPEQQKPSPSPQPRNSPSPRQLPSPGTESTQPAQTPQQRETPAATPRQLPQPSQTDGAPPGQPQSASSPD
ncbi:MAG TPA: protein kinase [Pyrinomonadaceae bacterium]|nr:protein kinase [Pyrinomonadaceae bacterium]